MFYSPVRAWTGRSWLQPRGCLEVEFGRLLRRTLKWPLLSRLGCRFLLLLGRVADSQLRPDGIEQLDLLFLLAVIQSPQNRFQSAQCDDDDNRLEHNRLHGI